MSASLTISSDPPASPDNADFAIYIDFRKGEGSPSRVFQAADAMIRALQNLDHILSASIDSHIEPVLVLEEIEIGSLKIWLKNILTSADDEALKTLDWKPAIGKYLVRAKYIYIEWANRDDPNATILDLAKRLASIAAETDVKHLPDYAPPSIRGLAEVTKEIEAAKSFLAPGDRMLYLPAPSKGWDVKNVEFSLTSSFSPEELISFAIKETLRYPGMPMTLIVKRPDYLGNSMWEFRHGKTPISARIWHEEWLQRFQKRQIDVRPGDALKCVVTLERSYGFDNELISETFLITQVVDVLHNIYQQGDLGV